MAKRKHRAAEPKIKHVEKPLLHEHLSTPTEIGSFLVEQYHAGETPEDVLAELQKRNVGATLAGVTLAMNKLGVWLDFVAKTFKA